MPSYRLTLSPIILIRWLWGWDGDVHLGDEETGSERWCQFPGTTQPVSDRAPAAQECLTAKSFLFPLVTSPLEQLTLCSPGRPHSLLAVAVVAEDAFLKTVQGHEADMLKHVKGDFWAFCQALPFSLEEKDTWQMGRDHRPSAGLTMAQLQVHYKTTL